MGDISSGLGMPSEDWGPGSLSFQAKVGRYSDVQGMTNKWYIGHWAAFYSKIHCLLHFLGYPSWICFLMFKACRHAYMVNM